LVKAFADGLPRDAELVNLRLHPDVAAVWQPGWRSFEAFDRDAGAGMMLVSRLAQAPGWVWAAPMQRLLHWMTVPTTHAIVHGATLTHDGTGLLLAGVSGSGKSTTTARALGGGFGTVGDDLVLVETARRRPVAHALFDAIKVDPSVACELTAAATNWTEVEHKKMCRISDLAPGALMSSFPLDAILIPRVVPGRSTRISAATPTDALRALAPSTMSILRGGEQSTLSKMAKLTRNLPAYHLELGADADQLLDAIRRA